METEEVIDLSTSFEDMEIDDKEMKIIKERSEKMDAKVLEKQKNRNRGFFEKKKDSFR